MTIEGPRPTDLPEGLCVGAGGATCGNQDGVTRSFQRSFFVNEVWTDEGSPGKYRWREVEHPVAKVEAIVWAVCPKCGFQWKTEYESRSPAPVCVSTIRTSAEMGFSRDGSQNVPNDPPVIPIVNELPPAPPSDDN